jgi:hypothetical protein
MEIKKITYKEVHEEFEVVVKVVIGKIVQDSNSP